MGINFGYLYTRKQIEEIQDDFLCDFFGVGIGEKFRSPFREDKKSGCFLKHSKNGILYFHDYAANVHLTAFQIYERNRHEFKNYRKKKKRRRKKFLLYVKTREFSDNDVRYWGAYGITIENLVKDLVFPISAYIAVSDKYNSAVEADKLAYVFSFYNEMKIYQPFSKKRKHIANVSQYTLIGDRIKEFDILILTKSYKDFRVLKNELKCVNVTAFQSETQYFIDSYINSFEYVIVIFDNDAPGIENSVKFIEMLKASKKKTLNIIIESKEKDVSDLYKNDKVNFLKFKDKTQCFITNTMKKLIESHIS